MRIIEYNMCYFENIIVRLLVLCYIASYYCRDRSLLICMVSYMVLCIQSNASTYYSTLWMYHKNIWMYIEYSKW